MADGTQQQDKPPPRRRAFPSPQPYQPRRRQQQEPADEPQVLRQQPADAAPGLPRQQPRQPATSSGASGGRGMPARGRGQGGGRGARQQPAPAAAGAGRQLAVRQPTRPAAMPAAASVAALVDVASDSRLPEADRAAALQQLHQRLFEPAAQREALQQLQALWPRLLALLWGDPSPLVTAAAAPAVGAIGALAVQAASAAGAAKAAQHGGPSASTSHGSASSGSSAGGLLFDWLLPVLQRKAGPDGRPLAPHQLAAVLAALRDCLTGVDATTLARYANAVFGACQAMLEDEATPPGALPPLLAVLQQAARHQHSLNPRFRDLVDLLLGWALEPALPEAARPGLSRALAAFGAQWRQQPAFAGSLLETLIADMQRLASKVAAEHKEAAADKGSPACGLSASLRQVLALAACVLPILDVAAAARLPSCQQHLLQLLRAFTQAILAATETPEAVAPVVTELSGHLARLSALAVAAAASPSGAAAASSAAEGSSSSGEHLPAEFDSRLLGLNLQEQNQTQADQPAEDRETPVAAALQGSRMQQLFQGVDTFAATAASQTGVLAQQAAVLAVLAAVRSWAHVLVQQQQHAQQQLNLLEPAAAALLPAPGQGSGGWLLSLRSYGAREVVAQCARLMLPLAVHSPAALRALLVDSVQQAEALRSAANEIWPGGGSGEAEAGREAAVSTGPSALLLFNLHLLLAAAPQLPPDSLHLIWRQLLPLAQPESALAAAASTMQHQQHQPQLQLLTLLEAATGLLMDRQLGLAAPSPSVMSSVALDTLLLLSSILTASSSSSGSNGGIPEQVLLLALRWLQQAAAWPAVAQAASFDGGSSTGSGSSMAGVLGAGLSCTSSASPAVRAAALQAVRALVCSRSGVASLLLNPGLAASLFQAAILHLSDFTPEAAHAAQELLAASASALALGSALCEPGDSSSRETSASPERAAPVALEAQQLVFNPSQLRQWLSYLTGHAAAPTTLLTAGGQQPTAPLREWLPRLMHTAQASSVATAHTRRVPSCLSQAAWWALQEAAKQCVASRLRTHHGGPAQNLAALERALQVAAAALMQQDPGTAQDQAKHAEGAEAGEPASAGGVSSNEERRQAAVLLLLFLHALEQGVAAASSGSAARSAAGQEASMFFEANEKVCQAWFSRLRPLLMRAAAAAEAHELAAHHSLQRLQDLHQQLLALLPSAPVDAPSGQAGEGGRGQEVEKALSPVAAAGLPPRTPFGAGARPRAPGDAGANPAAALLAATRGSPDMALRQEQLQSGAAAPTHGRSLSPQQLQGGAAKVAEAAASAAAALCALGDADGVAGLQAFCCSAFHSLLQHVKLAAAPSTAASPAASEAADTAWEWLVAVQHQAAGRHEDAIELYCRLYSPAAAGEPSAVVQCVPTGALARLAAGAYASLADAGGLRSWLETKPGSKLSAAAAARCMQLAQWEPTPACQEASNSHTSSPISELLLKLRLASLDPSAAAALEPAAAAACLAEVSVDPAHAAALLQQLSGSVLLKAVTADLGGYSHSSERLCSAWVLPAAAASATAAGPARAAGSLQPLVLLLGRGQLPAPQQVLLLLSAARAAARGGNAAASLRFLKRAEGLQQAGGCSTEGESFGKATALLLRLQRLQLPAACSSGNDDGDAWSLLRTAVDSSVAAAVVPAAAQLLLGEPCPPTAILASDVSIMARGLALASSSSSSSNSSSSSTFAQLEAHFLNTEQQAAEPAAVQYTVLKAAVASTQSSARHWVQWAEWLHKHAQQQQQVPEVHMAACQAAFVSSCKALSLAAASPAASSSSGSSGYAMMPLLLQLLHLLVKGPVSCLPADVSTQLSAVPAAAWLPVVPHLLSQLASSSIDSSPERQRQVHGLLLHIASAAPCQVLLPAMVAAAAQPVGTGEPQPGPPSEERLAALLGELQQQHSELARQLAVLTKEAARLAVLPEEHWHTVLQEAAATATKRLQAQQAPQPAAGTAEAESNLAGIAPVLLCLQQQLAAAEASQPETPHEQQFQAQQLPRLRKLLQQLTAPLDCPASAGPEQAETNSTGKAGPAAPPVQQRQHVVRVLRDAAGEMAAQLQSKLLKLSEVSPALSELAHTGIPMPGLPQAAGCAAVTVAGVGQEVVVLATKTRPKRLSFTGSDGVHHSFLLKGREDLRADACLMQLLRACRSALQAGAGGCWDAASGMAAAQCFEVVPMGSRVGLVQWVEGTVPLYEVYTGWQRHHTQRQRLLATAAAAQRQQQQQQQQKQKPKAAAVVVPLVVARPAAAKVARQPGKVVLAPKRVSVRVMPAAARPEASQAAAAQLLPQAKQQLRPIDTFYAKLKAVGIDPSSTRLGWPQAKLTQVLEGMQQTVDRQLLWREVWLGSSGAADLWQRQRRFAASVAAMSVVGHLLGLGDRHLDNILLHRGAAQLIHIDFSVVFDRGLQLKVPEVVPFRLTQTLVAALGVTGVEGAFRLACERALGALRANSAPLRALLEASLLDPRVDWDSEAAAKAASKAFGQAVALQLFALRQAADAGSLHSAAAAANVSLAAVAAALSGYVEQFLGLARSAAEAAESHALLQRCQATLGSAAEQERQLRAQAEEGQAALTAVLSAAQPVATQVLASLQECQAWQQRHEALLPMLLNNPPAALLSGPATVDPEAAAANSGTLIFLVSSPQGDARDAGQGSSSIVHAALGMLPAHAPLSARLLLQAAAVDKQGRQLHRERAAAAHQLAQALQQYTAAVACLLGGPRYSGSSQHAHWAAAFQAAMDLPVPQGFQRAAELAPCRPDPSTVLDGWRPLAASAAAAAGLEEHLSASAAALELERVDVAMSAADARQRMLECAASCWLAGALGTLHGPSSQQQGPSAVAQAFAAFSDVQATAVQRLAAEQQRRLLAEAEAEESGEEEADGEEEAAETLAAVERLVLGYASTAVSLRDATSEQLFLASGGFNLLAWLSEAVQAVDSLTTAAAELQLLLPPLLGLLCSPAQAGTVAAAVAAAADELEAAAAASNGPVQSGGDVLQSGAAEHASAAMEALLAAAAQHAAFAGLVQGLQQVQAASQLLLQPEDNPALAQQQMGLAGAVVAVWQELQYAMEASAAESSPSGGGPTADVAAGSAAVAEQSAPGAPWQQCSAVLAEAVAAEVAQHLLPPLATALSGTAAALRAAGPSLARRAGLEAAAAPPLPLLPGGGSVQPPRGLPGRAGTPDLVPFTDFDDRQLPGAGMLLGGMLLEELEPIGGGGDSQAEGGGMQGGLLQPGTGSGGGAGAPQPSLVPFLDFDESLAGAGVALEAPEAAGDEFEGLEGGSGAGLSLDLSQLSLSQVSGGQLEGSEGGAGTSAPSLEAQLAALLEAAAEAAGALAAVGAAQYVSRLALQQCQMAKQQCCAELAAFQWVNEHMLPSEAASAAASLLHSAPPPSVAAAAAAGAALPPVCAALAGWELRSSRQELLAQLRAASGTLLSLDAPLQQWQAQLAAVQQQLAEEVAAAVPYSAAKLQGCLQRQQHWLQGATAHAANLLELSLAVLQFEAARTADAQQQPGMLRAAPEQQVSQPGADRYQAEQQDGWRRYSALLQHMQRLHDSYTAADGSLARAASELQQLSLRRQEATSLMQSAEAAGSTAASSFAASALPLVRATQQLPTTLAQLLPQLAACTGWHQQLRQAQRQVAELAAAAAMPASSAAAAEQAAEHLGAAATCLQELPAAVHELQAVLLPVRNKLLAGGRGDAAAKQQAAEVVDAVGAAVAGLGPQINKAHQVQRWLASLPPSLQTLAAQAAEQAAVLQSQHGFSLHGLEQLLVGQNGTAGVTTAPPAAVRSGALTGALMLPCGAPPRREETRQERKQYAASLLQRFQAKLMGHGMELDGGASGGALDEQRCVQQLIEAAAAPANLALMYEGWMPWV